MANFVTTATGTSAMDNSLVLEYWNGIVLASTPELVASQVATINEQINAKSIDFSKYPNIAVSVSALTELEDVASTALSDTAVTLTPAEHGLAVTTTKLASFQTGGKVDLAAVALVGRHMGSYMDKAAIEALDAFGGTTIYPNAATAASNLATSDIMDKAFAGRLYNKLARANTPGIAGSYIGIAHDDVLFDLKDDAGAGGWTDVSKYSDLVSVLNNEVGMFKGIRWLRSGNATVTSDSNGTIDSYKVNVVGFNALGYAVSVAPHMVITGPYDKLGRFVNIGWHGIFHFDTVDAANQVLGICASSVGANS